MTRLLALIFAACLAAPSLARADDPPEVRPPPPAPAAGALDDSASRPGDVSRPEFEQRLSPYGRWVETPEYGRVWVPGGLAATWRPYTYGRWVLTDWGWTWVSDEPFGWATYHYGRWWYGASYGWYWVPGRRWGPAWVSWRWSGGYVAWVPLVPRNQVLWGVRSNYWVAVQTQHFTQPIRTVALAPQATLGVVAQTRPLGGAYSRPVQGMFGPPVAAISKATGQQIRPVSAGKVVPGAMAHAQSGNARATAPARPPRAPGTPRVGRPGQGGTPSKPGTPAPGFRRGRRR